jgi:hypothetical protein
MNGETQRGVVINVHAFGAVVRLEDGRLASVPAADLSRNRDAYDRALTRRKPAEFMLTGDERHPLAMLAPQMHDADFEEQIAQYLKMTQEWEKPDVPPAHERHFLRKKRRAALFESRHSPDS